MVGDITFGGWLKHRRRQLDLTQKELAYQAGCSVGTIRKIEADERRPSRQLATLLAEHLDIPPEQHEPFIAFARAEPYTADISLPILAPADEQTLAIPAATQEAPAQPVKHNLPSAMTPFLGRDAELATIDDLLTNLDRQLVTIVGPGGIGKTRLALAYAEQLVTATPQPAQNSRYDNGIFFVDLAPLSAAERMILALAEALDIRLQEGAQEKRSPRLQLLDYVRNKRMLLLLDNFEHILSPSHRPDTGAEADGAALVAEILQNAPEVQILVTSRERLNLRIEQVFPIEGLTFPDWDLAAPEDEVAAAGEYTAVRLFLQAAQRFQPDFVLESREELAVLVRICRLVGGMPLALELAASWADTLSLVDLVTELQQGLDILETELRDMPERQRSVQATFDYSWRKLGKKEQFVFAQLSIFRGGFTRPAAQRVTGATPQQLSRLINKSFIQFNKQRNRFQVHELLRQYGADRLGRDSELERAVYDRHSAYFCWFIRKHNDDLKGSLQTQASLAIEADIDNIRLAWNHAITRQDLELIGISFESLFRFYWNNSWLIKGINEFEKAESMLRTGDPIGKRGVVLGRLLAFLGRFYGEAGQTGKAMETLEESLELVQRLGDREEELIPLLFLASHLGEFEGSLKESNRLFVESLPLAREIGDGWATGHALIYLGGNALKAGDYEQADRRWREALKLFTQTGDLGAIQSTLCCLSNLAIDRGQYQEALSLAREVMSVAREFNPTFPIMGLESLGKAVYAIGEYWEAEELLQQGLALERERDHRYWVPSWLFQLGEVAFSTRDHARATQRYKESLAGAVEFDNQELVARNHDALGRLNMVRGAGMQAREHFQAALQVALPLERPPIHLAILVTVAELFAEEGDLEYAALLGMLITNHPASQAKIKERSRLLLTGLEAELSVNDLANIRERSRQSDLSTVASKLLQDLESL